MTPIKYIPEFRLEKVKSKLKKTQIKDLGKAVSFCRKFWSTDISIYESFFILLFDSASNVIGYAKISQGGVAGTVVDPRVIYQYAALSMASSAIICHNHPSGRITPSPSDKHITALIKEGLQEICNCRLVDHLIITEKSYYSFANKGKI